jgi:DNA-directed RNA polymerase subunit RPC12/RpoP
MAEVAWKCEGCEEVTQEEPDDPLYECSRCGERFLREDSYDGDSNRCPGCNVFAARAGFACSQCGEGPVIEGILVDGEWQEPPAPPPPPRRPEDRYDVGYADGDWGEVTDNGYASDGWFVWDSEQDSPYGDTFALIVAGPFGSERKALAARDMLVAGDADGKEATSG